MSPFVFVTHSVEKHLEAQRILGHAIERHALNLPEIQHVDIEPVSLFKVRAAYEALRRPVMIEDTGLFIEEWHGLPGALIRWFEERVGVTGICEMLAHASSRNALARTIVATYDGISDPMMFVGAVEGRIAESPAGENGFGWDRIFIPRGENRTFAQMPPEEKDQHSMRRQAFVRMAAYYRGTTSI